MHLASASVGEMDFLVTWNLRHLYKRGTQEMVREVNTLGSKSSDLDISRQVVDMKAKVDRLREQTQNIE